MNVEADDGPRAQVVLGAAMLVDRVGFGTMAVAGNYGDVAEADARAMLRTASAVAACLVDTADMYAGGSVERWLGDLDLTALPSVVATKVGLVRNASSPYGVDIVGRPDYLREAVLRSAERMRLATIPLVLLHRVDDAVPVEESIGALAELVREGRIVGIGLSEASAESIRRAHATWPLSAVQSEYSLWSRDIETAGVLDALRELDVPLIASSPLGKGFLAKGLSWPPPPGARDSRNKLPRFAPGAYERNLQLLPTLDVVAKRLGASRAQVALAWVLSRWDRIVVIPATRRPARFADNLASCGLRLTPADISLLEHSFEADRVIGDRYSDMAFVNR